MVDVEKVAHAAHWCRNRAEKIAGGISSFKADEGPKIADCLTSQLVHAGLGELVGDINRNRWRSVQKCLGYLSTWANRLDAMLPSATQGDVRADASKLFPKGVPDNVNIVDLVVRLNAAKGTGKSMAEIAREFIGDDRKAQSLLTQIRRLRKQGRISL